MNRNYIVFHLNSIQPSNANILKKTKLYFILFFDFSLTVNAVPHECVIRTGQP